MSLPDIKVRVSTPAPVTARIGGTASLPMRVGDTYRGKSAYDYAVRAGYTGTEEEFARTQYQSGDNALRAEQAAVAAEQSVEKVHNMQADAVRLAGDADPTASYDGDTGTLHFGIPVQEIDDERTTLTTLWSSKKTSDMLDAMGEEVAKKVDNDTYTTDKGNLETEIAGKVDAESYAADMAALDVVLADKVDSSSMGDALGEKVDKSAVTQSYTAEGADQIMSAAAVQELVASSGGSSESIAAMRVTLDVVPGTTEYTVSGVTAAMVVAESSIPSGVQGGDWTVATGANKVTIGGTISKSGTVTFLLVENGSEFVAANNARFERLEGKFETATFPFSFAVVANQWKHQNITNDLAKPGYTAIGTFVTQTDTSIAGNCRLFAESFQDTQLFVHAFALSATTVTGTVRVLYIKN